MKNWFGFWVSWALWEVAGAEAAQVVTDTGARRSMSECLRLS